MKITANFYKSPYNKSCKRFEKNKTSQNSFISKNNLYQIYYKPISFKSNSSASFPYEEIKKHFNDYLKKIEEKSDHKNKRNLYVDSIIELQDKMYGSNLYSCASYGSLVRDYAHETAGQLAYLSGHAGASLINKGYIDFDFDKKAKENYQDALEITKIYKTFIDKGLEKNNHSVDNVINMAIKPFEKRIKDKNLKLNVSIDEKLKNKKINTELSNYKVYVVLNNLISNSVKYTQKNGTIDISTKLNKSEKLLTISVKDNGRGIPQEEIEKASRGGHRASNVVDSDIPGTGYGLGRSNRIVAGAKHPERFKIISSTLGKNKGTKVTVKFVIKKQD